MPQTDTKVLPLRRSPSLFARITGFLVQALSRSRARQHLGQLDAHLLRDIGLDPNAAQEECAKPFWRS